MYDLCVKDNHNYVITKNNYIVHNSKTFTGCVWIIYNCLKYNKVRYLIGRRELTNLKKTTLRTFFEVANLFKLQSDIHYKFNAQDNVIKFSNGSEIFLFDMAHKPSDPDYLRFGGLELTGAFVDESNECDIKAIDILKTRIGRCLNDKYEILPKLLETFNPSKNHIYSRFWLPFKNGSMPKHRIFVRALPTDNPYLSQEYIRQLENADEITRERLLKGNFDYDDDDRNLVNFKQITNCFYNNFVMEGKKTISSDLAMQGRDNFVISVWNGLRVRFPLVKIKATGKEIETDLKAVSESEKILRSNIVVDSDGLGNYLESYIQGIECFRAVKTAINPEFSNIKSECAFKLAEYIRKGLLFIDVKEDEQVFVKGRYVRLRDILVEELSQLKRDLISFEKDQKKKIISKDEMKQNLGRSPDFLDVLLMNMIFYVQDTKLGVLDSNGVI